MRRYLIYLFLFVLAGHALSRVVTSYDSIWSIHLAMSIVNDLDTDLTEYKSQIEGMNSYAIHTIGDKLYYIFPVGPSLLVVPGMFVVKWVSRGQDWIRERMGVTVQDPQARIMRSSGEWEERFASLIIAFATILMFLIANETLDKKQATAVALLFAFCTSAWSTASRGLWQHGPVMLMLSLCILICLYARRRQELVAYLGFPLAYAFVCRPTMAVPVLGFSAYVALLYPKQLVKFLLCAFVVAVPFLSYNYSVYGTILSPYYGTDTAFSKNTFWLALYGNLLSPSRGLLIFSPIFFFVTYGVLLKVRNRQFTALDLLLLILIVAHWVVISTARMWYGGASYGPRFFADVVPLLIYFLIPVIQHLFDPDARRATGRNIFLVAVAISFLIHFRGANHEAVYRWNIEAPPVERFFDWGNAQFLAGWTRSR